MPHHAREPFRVGGARAHDPADLLLQRADARASRGANGRCGRSPAARPRGGAPRRRGRPRTGSSRRCRAGRARDCPGCAGPARPRRGAARTAGARPRPRPRRHRRSRPRRGRRARDRPRLPSRARRSAPAGRRRRRRAWCRTRGSSRAARARLGGDALRRQRRRVGPRTRAAIGLTLLRLVQRRPPRGTASSNSSICAGKASRKKPETRKVTSTRGRSSTPERQDLDAGDPVRGARPRPGGSRSAPAPGRCRRRRCACWRCPRRTAPPCRGQSPCSCTIALDQQLGRAPAEMPGRRRRHGAAVDRVEVAAGRQHVGPAAGRRAARAGLDEAGRPAPRSTPAISAVAAGLPRAGRRRRSISSQHGAGRASSRARAPARRRPARAPAAPGARPCRPGVRQGWRSAPAEPPAAGPARARPAWQPSGSQPQPEIGAPARAAARRRRPRRAPRGTRASATSRSVSWSPVGRAGRTRAGRRGSAAPSARTDGCRACASASSGASPGAMPRSRSRPEALAAAPGSRRAGRPGGAGRAPAAS